MQPHGVDKCIPHGVDSMIGNNCKPMGWTYYLPHGYSSTIWSSVNPMGDTYCQPHGELNLTIWYVHSMGDTNRPPHGVFQSVLIIVNPMGDTDVTENLGPFRYLLPWKQWGYDLTRCSWLSTAWVIWLTLIVSPMGRFCVVNIRCHTQGCYVLQSHPRRLHFKSKTEQHGQDQWCLQCCSRCDRGAYIASLRVSKFNVYVPRVRVRVEFEMLIYTFTENYITLYVTIVLNVEA